MLRIFKPLTASALITLAVSSCATKSPKFVTPPVAKPVPVAPQVRKISQPLDNAAEINTKAQAYTATILDELKRARDEIDKIKDTKEVSKLNHNTLVESWKTLGDNSERLTYYAKSLEGALTTQGVELKKAKVALADALSQASSADSMARDQARYLENAIKHAEAADKQNDKLLGAVAAAEARAAIYIKWLTILTGALTLYVGLRVCKLLPSFKPCLFWVP